MLFIGHRGHHQAPTLEPAVTRHPHGGIDHGGHAALHVLAAPPVKAPVPDGRIERRSHPFHTDGIHMATEDQRAPGRPPFDHPDHVRTLGRDIGHLDIDAARPQGRRDSLGDRRLTRPTGNQ